MNSSRDCKLRGIETRRLADGSTAYRVYYRVPAPGGRRRLNRQFATIAEATAFRQRFTGRVAPREQLTVAGFVARHWLPAAEQRQKPSSFRCARGMLTNYLLPFFGCTPLDRLQRAQWEGFALRVLGRTGQPLSAKSRQNLFILFHAILQNAVELDLLDKNPLARPLGSRRNLLRPASAQRFEKPVLSPAQFQQLLAATPEHRRPLLWMFAVTGLRASEVAGLTWADYDQQARELFIRRAIIRGHVDLPKTGATIRKVGVTTHLAAQLAAQREYQAAQLTARRRAGGCVPALADFIFASPSGKPWDADRARRQILYPALRRAGLIAALPPSQQGRAPRYLSNRSYGWHLFRHSAITAHLAQTGDIYRASKFAGHASVKVTESIYAHVKPAALAEAELVQQYWQRPPQIPSPIPLASDKPQ